ncbi:hypothetical protein SEA_JEON_74 [Mycobacterium phage Jeon]|uniref:Uncharacterized protein n=1 Tax=Mycobacterium phage Jeon TaxID=2108123 RepID=A0A2P1JRK6_9CAUD|nr:hypothetical protein PQB70_gp79 [Mycobacterium phage Jeon]AVO21776.1 hypothetical protein SEA_JEON_74 [Mycobacterium phage Jeon]
MSIVKEIERTELSPMLRKANRSLFVAFVNSRLSERAGLDADRSVMLYDADKMFEFALDEVPTERMLRQLYQHTNVRFWSWGV